MAHSNSRGSHFANSVGSVQAGRTDADSGGDSSASRKMRTISGASGELPKIVPQGTAGYGGGEDRYTLVRSEQKYSRYNERYTIRREAAETPEPLARAQEYVRQFDTSSMEGVPAYSWRPFMTYGLVCIAVCVLWCLIVVLMNVSGKAPYGSVEMMFGLVLLVLEIVGCVGVAIGATLASSSADGDLSRADLFASSIGKASMMLLANLVVWTIVATLVF